MQVAREKKMKSTNTFKKVLLVAGGLAILNMVQFPSDTVLDRLQSVVTNQIEVHAEELPYSPNWNVKADGNWMYKTGDNTWATNAWVQDEVDKNWYLLDNDGNMRTGLFKSYDRYYMLSEEHDGHFGRLVKNGEVYKGITVEADTSADYEGALSQNTINQLLAQGYSLDTATEVTGTQHVTSPSASASSTTSASASTPSKIRAAIDPATGIYMDIDGKPVPDAYMGPDGYMVVKIHNKRYNTVTEEPARYASRMQDAQDWYDSRSDEEISAWVRSIDNDGVKIH